MTIILFWIVIGIATFFFGWNSLDKSMSPENTYNIIPPHERRTTLKVFFVFSILLGPIMTAWFVWSWLRRKIRKEE